ncbi:MAG: hypothetical protein SGPRY_014031 [Prymnesium sp.]
MVSTNTMLSYDPEFEVWYDAVDRGHRPTSRSGHSACLHTSNGKGAKLLVFGGVGAGGRKFAEPELHELHISSDWSWKRALSAGKPPFARAYHSATLISVRTSTLSISSCLPAHPGSHAVRSRMGEC